MGGYAICAGLEQIIDYIKNLKFDEDDISYLKSLNKFSDSFFRPSKISCAIYTKRKGPLRGKLQTFRALLTQGQILC